MSDILVVIVLGNRLNDDGTITDIQKERLEMALEIENLYHPNFYILSGGIANPKAIISEAKGMYDYLIKKGIDENKLIMEDKSFTTVENAKYSIPIAKSLSATKIIVCTSSYHLGDPKYEAMSSFTKELENSNITLMTYSR